MNHRHLMLVFGVLASLIAACSHAPSISIITPDGKQLATVQVEIANTPQQRELGLMYRKQLDQDAGMIFIFKSPKQQAFWMHNTEIPLDMIFAGENRRILGIVANAEPHTDTPRSVDGESLYVLEVNGGYAARHNIQAGDRLDFSGFPTISAQ
ncbi:MAG TPA: DUF192 domain-containing protein [Candidatus Binataceae bacterium]|nr:DUF192 domain-containing protein [Candidatus Binataceae bacterium]